MKYKSLGIIVLIIVLFVSCKKYPENTVLFHSIRKIKFFDKMKITSYKIDGVESLNDLNNYFGPVFTVKDFSQVQFNESYDPNYGANVPNILIPFNGGFHTEFSYSYSKNKKSICISTKDNLFDTVIYNKNIFIRKISKWDIIKLVPNGERKIRTIINNHSYEIILNSYN